MSLFEQHHFGIRDFEIVGKTDVGRATVDALNLNHERRIRVGKAEVQFDLFPPD